MLPYGACFHFIGLFRSEALTIKVEKKCKNAAYAVPIKSQIFLVNIYFIYRYSKIKK